MSLTQSKITMFPSARNKERLKQNKKETKTEKGKKWSKLSTFGTAEHGIPIFWDVKSRRMRPKALHGRKWKINHVHKAGSYLLRKRRWTSFDLESRILQ